MRTNSSILLIGAGRLALHLKHWSNLNDSSLQILTWSRQEPIEKLNLLLPKAEIVWLAISDSAIVPFFEEHLKHLNKKVVHFSGALHDSRLASAHPLMSFPSELLEDPLYSKIHFVICGLNYLTEALPSFKNNCSKITAEQKPFYHALCVIAGNFPQLLWQETLTEMRALQIPDAAFELYIKQVAQNYIALKDKALTGPLIRKDLVTVEKNILGLTTKTKLKNIYQTFVQEFLK